MKESAMLKEVQTVFNVGYDESIQTFIKGMQYKFPGTIPFKMYMDLLF